MRNFTLNQAIKDVDLKIVSLKLKTKAWSLHQLKQITFQKDQLKTILLLKVRRMPLL